MTRPQPSSDDDVAVITRNFMKVFGRAPDLANPTTFNEKIIYKMIHDRRPLLTRLADKLTARDYVAERIGPQYLPRIYQVCRSPAEIDWARLPRQFMLKANHGCGMNVLVFDKSVIDAGVLARHVGEWLIRDYYRFLREWAYRDTEPAIYTEELLTQGSALATDWKFHTFDGHVEFLQVLSGKPNSPGRADYDRRLNRIPIKGQQFPTSPIDPPIPRNLDQMISVAETLGRGLDYIRVDMYNLDGRIVFGEFTHYPTAGLFPFDPPEIDVLYGSKWRVPPSYA